ncbi:MAG: hypothetical protein ACYTGZ_14595 [Planctomycetota bacterium]|jgi:hypothetical protein
MERKRKLAIGCGTVTFLCAWGFLSLLGLSGCSLTFHDQSYFANVRGYPGHETAQHDDVEVSFGIDPKVRAEYMFAFPFVTFGEDTDTHYVHVTVSTRERKAIQYARIVRAELVGADAALPIPLTPNTAFEPEMDGGWQKMRVIDDYYSPDEVEALYFVGGGMHVPDSFKEVRFVVEFRIREGSSERTLTLEAPFHRVTKSRPAYLSHPPGY